jgi:photosystem II stability/assembly factor-like uncharacterized protein
MMMFSFLFFITSAPLLAQNYGWVKTATLDSVYGLVSINFVDSLHGWAGAGSGQVFRSTDGGLTWKGYATDAPFVVYSLSMLDSLRGWGAGTDGIYGDIIRTTDGGKTWDWQREEFPRQYRGTYTFSDKKNITIGQTHNSTPPDTGVIVQTTDGGKTWTEQSTSFSNHLYSVTFADSLNGWIVADAGLLKTEDGGRSWIPLPGPSFVMLSFLDSLKGWGAGQFGDAREIYQTVEGGGNWTTEYCFCSSSDELYPRAISFVDSLDGWAFGHIFYQGGDAAAIYKTTDGGNTWARDIVTQTDVDFRAGTIVGRYHGWAVGSSGSVYSYQPVTAVVERVPEVPRSFALCQNYPNPFNPTTTIEYELVKRDRVTLTVTDVLGRKVKELIRNEEQEAGTYRVHFDAGSLSSGTYHYTIRTGTFTNTKQMTLLK